MLSTMLVMLLESTRPKGPLELQNRFFFYWAEIVRWLKNRESNTPRNTMLSLKLVCIVG